MKSRVGYYKKASSAVLVTDAKAMFLADAEDICQERIYFSVGSVACSMLDPPSHVAYLF